MHMPVRPPSFFVRLGSRFAPVALAAALLAPASAWAGELAFGAEPLVTDDQGKLTAEGRKQTVKELASEPGEELWNLHVWAKVDKGGPGPLYLEFFGKLPDGKPYLAYSHEKSDYEGEKFVTMDVELDGNRGINKGKTYDVKLTQVSAKGKDITLANGKLTLTYTEPAPEAEGEGEGDTDGAEEPEATNTEEQDAIDSLAGGEAPAGDTAEGPPPVEPTGKKGCSVDPTPLSVPGALALFVIGAGVARRRRD